jgi:hypothetical protein
MQKQDVDMCLMVSDEANRILHKAFARMFDYKVILKNDTTLAFGVCLQKVGPYSHMRVKTTIHPTSVIFCKMLIDYTIWRYGEEIELSTGVRSPVGTVLKINAVYWTR